MKNKIVATALSSAALLATVASPAHAFLGASDATDANAGSTVYLLAGTNYCTGTVIGANWVITARHCVEGGVPSGTLQEGGTHGTSVNYDRVVQNPGAEDIALLHTSTALKSTPAQLWTGPDAPGGAKVTAFGWGGDSITPFSKIQQATGVTEAQRQNVSPMADMSSIGVDYDGKNQSTHGDSGGPVFLDGKLYGVFSMFTPAVPVDGQANSGWYASVSDVQKWITAQMGAGSTDAPTTSPTSSGVPTAGSTSQSTVPSTGSTTLTQASSSSDPSSTESSSSSSASSASTSPRTSSPILTGTMPDSTRTAGTANYAAKTDGLQVDTGGTVEKSLWSKIVDSLR